MGVTAAVVASMSIAMYTDTPGAAMQASTYRTSPRNTVDDEKLPAPAAVPSPPRWVLRRPPIPFPIPFPVVYGQRRQVVRCAQGQGAAEAQLVIMLHCCVHGVVWCHVRNGWDHIILSLAASGCKGVELSLSLIGHTCRAATTLHVCAMTRNQAGPNVRVAIRAILFAACGRMSWIFVQS